MDNLTPQQKKKIEKIADVVDNGNLAVAKMIFELEEKVDDLLPDVKNIISQVKGEKGEDSTVPGPKGDKGEDGKDGRDGRDGVDGKDGKDGKNGKDGKDGLNGQDGKDADVAFAISTIEKNIPTLSEPIRDALELITDEDEKLKIDAIGHLREELNKVKKGSGQHYIGGVTEQKVIDLIAAGGGGGTPGGSDTQVQFNDGGAFGGDSRFTFDKTTGYLTSDGTYAKFGGTAAGATLAGVGTAIELTGTEDNVDGVQMAVNNISTGTAAYSGYTLTNDLGDNNYTHYFGIYLNSSNYNDTSFGDALNTPNLGSLQNTDGPISIIANANDATGYIDFHTAGVGIENERMRINNNGVVDVMKNTLGSESVTNGNFATSASWTFGTGWAFQGTPNFNAIKSSDGTATLSQNMTTTVDEVYLLTFTISNYTVGSVTPSVGGTTGTERSGNGTYYERIQAAESSGLAFTPSNTARFTIDAISVKKVDGGTLRAGLLDAHQIATTVPTPTGFTADAIFGYPGYSFGSGNKSYRVEQRIGGVYSTFLSGSFTEPATSVGNPTSATATIGYDSGGGYTLTGVQKDFQYYAVYQDGTISPGFASANCTDDGVTDNYNIQHDISGAGGTPSQYLIIRDATDYLLTGSSNTSFSDTNSGSWTALPHGLSTVSTYIVQLGIAAATGVNLYIFRNVTSTAKYTTSTTTSVLDSNDMTTGTPTLSPTTGPDDTLIADGNVKLAGTTASAFGIFSKAAIPAPYQGTVAQDVITSLSNYGFVGTDARYDSTKLINAVAVAQGGTGLTTFGSTGRIPFATDSGAGLTTDASINIQSGTTAGQRRLGVGTTSPAAIGHFVGTAYSPGRFGYDTSNYMDIAVSSAGAVTLNAVGSSASFIISDSVIFSHRMQGLQAADVASANNLVLGNGNAFEITGTTQINLISNLSWQNGSQVTLLFTSTPTVKHNQTTSTTNITIQLAGAADFVASAGDTLTLILSEIGGTQAWREISRAVI